VLTTIERAVYTTEASQDVVDAYTWYETHEPGLGEDFLRCVEACVLGLKRHPQLYPVAVDEFRRALVRRFPFEIFYEAREDSIVIYSVFHCSQNPQKWRSCLGLEG
jgi:plasmid stabilization system protein ParE